MLRAPGFPAAGVLRLAAPELARRADELVAGDASASAEEFERGFAAAVDETAAALGEIAASPRFRTAVAWQNHRLLETGLESLLRRLAEGGPRRSSARRREELVARYWQRYCVKNDTIGFFGPVGWARVDEAAPSTSLRPGERLLDGCDVLFEPWAVETLARAIASEPGVSEWLPPAPEPYVAVEDGKLLVPRAPWRELAPLDAAVLRRCDGVTPAHRIADTLVERGEAASPAAVLAALERLRRRRLVRPPLDLPFGLRPERELRRRCDLIGDSAVRRRATEPLDALEAARGRVEAAEDDPERLAAALDHLDATFMRLTAAAPTRNPGQTYGGRTLVYHDCRRAVELTIGRDVLDAAAPVELLARSARWFTHRVAEGASAELWALHRRLAERDAGPARLSTFWFEALALLQQHGPGLVAAARDALCERWTRLLRVRGDERHVRRPAGELRAAVAEAFDAPHAGWGGARYVSPDLLVAAPGVEAIRRGELEVVLGELHVAIAACRHACLVSRHPAPDELLAELDRDFPEPRLLPVLPRESPPRMPARARPALTRDRDFLVALFGGGVDPARPRLVRSGDVAVVPGADGRLAACLPGGETFDVLDVLTEVLTDLVVDRFGVLADAPHTPRVTIDRLVVAREAWSFACADLEFAWEARESRRFLELWRWHGSASLPRHVYATLPGEAKPFYVDFESTVYAAMLARAVRRAAEADSGAAVRLVEMLPALDRLWLVDGAGNRYTSELRLVLFDLRPIPELTPIGRSEGLAKRSSLHGL